MEAIAKPGLRVRAGRPAYGTYGAGDGGSAGVSTVFELRFAERWGTIGAMQAARPSALDMTPDAWRDLCRGWGVPAFRAGQICRALYVRRAGAFEAMHTLPAALRARLAESFLDPEGTARVQAVEGRRGGTRKLLLALCDGQCVEAVVIPARGRVTVCVSSQAGCAFGCAFCASGKRGLVRDLGCGEMVAQVLRATELLGGRPGNVVFMGIGEPLANYEPVLGAVRVLNHPEGLGIGARHLTLSTCGVVPGIRRLAEEGLQVELSVSLHAPTDAQRDVLMPANRRWPLAALMAACRDYTARTNRIITFEYTLVRGFNDRPSDARALLRLLAGWPCRVNLIPLSPIAEFDGETPPAEVLEAFREALVRGGVNATLRRSRGADVNAACGQLRLRHAVRDAGAADGAGL